MKKLATKNAIVESTRLVIGHQTGSAAFPAGSVLHRKRILQPGIGKIADDHLLDRLEQLELVAPFRDPERHHGLQRRAARKGTGDFRNGDDRLLRELEALARPLRHPFDDREAFRAFPDERKHGLSLSHGTHAVRKAPAMHAKMSRCLTPTVSSLPASWAGRSCIPARRCCTTTGSRSTSWPGLTCRLRSARRDSPQPCARCIP